MGLTRKMLNGMGLTAEQVDAIIEEHANTVDSLKEQRDDYKEKADKLKDVQSELDNLRKQVEDGTGDAAEWKDKYEKEHKAFDEYKKAEEHKAQVETIKDAYTKLLKENNVGEKHITSILGVTNFDDMKLDTNGNLEGVDKLTETIKEQWGGFITTTGTEGAGVETPPSGGSGTKYSSRAEIMKITDTAKRQEAIKNNPELFN
jgi:DNA repair exonuclease SbcCD ATPase subunit